MTSPDGWLKRRDELQAIYHRLQGRLSRSLRSGA